MRYYIGQCEYKWSHANKPMEALWIQRQVGTDIYRTVEENNWDWVWLRTNSQTLPGDVYCRCDIYVEIPNSKQGTWFMLKYPQAQLVEKAV